MRPVLVNQIDMQQFALERVDDKRVTFVYRVKGHGWQASDTGPRTWWSGADLAVGAAYMRLAEPLGEAREEMDHGQA